MVNPHQVSAHLFVNVRLTIVLKVDFIPSLFLLLDLCILIRHFLLKLFNSFWFSSFGILWCRVHFLFLLFKWLLQGCRYYFLNWASYGHLLLTLNIYVLSNYPTFAFNAILLIFKYQISILPIFLCSSRLFLIVTCGIILWYWDPRINAQEVLIE